MFRVLHIMGCGDVGGISKVILNYYQHMDRNKVHFDIALTVDIEGQNVQQLRNLGCTIYHLPLKSKGIIKFADALSSLLRNNHFDAIHVHENETSYVALQIAKRAGIPCRIAHSHTTAPCFTLYDHFKRLTGIVFNNIYATNIIGCGKLAGERVFGKNSMKKTKSAVLPNAIDTTKYCFNEVIRTEVRHALNISNDEIVIGMVGRISREKNYFQALRIFETICDVLPKTKLLIAGNGELEAELTHGIEQNKYKNKIVFLGKRNDINRLLQAYDIFFLPSINEGFPIAAVEAMASGLPIMLSDTITRELGFGSAVNYIPLSCYNCWVDCVKKYIGDKNRHARQNEVREHGLEIRDAVHNLIEIYASSATGDT